MSHRRTYSMDVDELDYLEKRGLPYPDQSHGNKASQQPKQPRHYHSQLSGEGVFGISAYGLIILCFLTFSGLLLFGLVHGFWHLCVHYSAHSAATTTARQSQLLH